MTFNPTCDVRAHICLVCIACRYLVLSNAEFPFGRLSDMRQEKHPMFYSSVTISIYASDQWDSLVDIWRLLTRRWQCEMQVCLSTDQRIGIHQQNLHDNKRERGKTHRGLTFISSPRSVFSPLHFVFENNDGTSDNHTEYIRATNARLIGLSSSLFPSFHERCRPHRRAPDHESSCSRVCVQHRRPAAAPLDLERDQRETVRRLGTVRIKDAPQ